MMSKFVMMKDEFDPATTCGLCGARLKDDDVPSERFTATELIVLLHLHTQEELVPSTAVKNAIASLKSRQMICETEHNGCVPFCNSAFAHDVCCQITHDEYQETPYPCDSELEPEGGPDGREDRQGD